MSVTITRLALDHFRSWNHCVVDFAPGVTIIQGANGQGKTNLVEAIEVLSTGSSHRVSSSLPLIERGQSEATIRANIVDDARNSADIQQQDTNSESTAESHESQNREIARKLNEQQNSQDGVASDIDSPTTIEVTIRSHGANRARIDGGNSLYMRDILGRVPSMSFTPEDQRLVSGDPAGRRGFVNQAGALLVPGYAAVHQRCVKIAKQRSALLKQIGKAAAAGNTQLVEPALNGLEIWTGQFIEAGMELTRMRERIVNRLAEPFAAIYDELAQSSQHAAITYEPSFEEAVGTVEDAYAGIESAGTLISQHFQRIYQGELARGQNLIGPHRDDLAITLDDVPAKEFASNGEMWTMALALKMALFDVVKQTSGNTPIVILDDVFAQLDEQRRRQILEFAMKQDQVLITVAAAGDVPDVSKYGKKARIVDIAALHDKADAQESQQLLADAMVAKIKAAREQSADDRIEASA